MPAITVVIPTYNRASYVCSAIDSVLLQTFEDFEIIVIDDGSTDDTLARLSAYRDKRLKVIHQNNLSQGIARNTGILESSGEYIAFLDSDDVWLPDKLELQYMQLRRSLNCFWSYTNAFSFQNSINNLYDFSERMILHSGSISSKLIKLNFIGTSTVMVKKDCFDSVGLFSDLPKAQDWDIWLRLASKFDICMVPEALVGYRVHEGMVTKNQTPYFAHLCHIRVLNRAVLFAPLVYSQFHNDAISIQCKNTAIRFLSINKPLRARFMLYKAIVMNQWSMQLYVYWVITFCSSKCLVVAKELHKVIGIFFIFIRSYRR